MPEKSCSFISRRLLGLAFFALGVGTAVAQDAAAVPSAAQTPQLATQRYGGDHEFGFIVGYSPISGPIWGYDENVLYSPTIVRYSYLIKNKAHGSFRYSPEVTVLSIMHEKSPSLTNPAAPITHFGAGISPVGFQIDWRKGYKTQPFFSTDGGFLYFADRVLSPQGSQYMYTIDFGGGVNLFTSARNALVLGYRYQHMSNANISFHNPGTDTDTFYIGYSHFHTHGVR